MAKSREQTNQRVRDAFDDLAVEDKALFVLEAMASTVIGSIERVADAMSSVIGDVFDGPQSDGGESHEEDSPAATKRKSTTKKKRTTKRTTKRATRSTSKKPAEG